MLAWEAPGCWPPHTAGGTSGDGVSAAWGGSAAGAFGLLRVATVQPGDPGRAAHIQRLVQAVARSWQLVPNQDEAVTVVLRCLFEVTTG